MSRLRAPSADGGTLCVPDWSAWPDVVAANRPLQSAWRVEILGRSLGDLRQQARRDLLLAAAQYTGQYRDLPTGDLAQALERPIVLGGHQPELFHPGVWLKNFALDELSRRVAGTAVNLVIDADAFKTHELPVPVRVAGRVTRHLIPFDVAAAPTVHEERRVVDSALFASFGERVAAELRPLVAEPWIKSVWPRIVARAKITGHIGSAFAQTRHQLEGELGLSTFEVPQSVFCTQPVFHHFVAHLIAERHRFRDVYNQAIRDYRQRHHLRSASHPAPELRLMVEHVELPFWTWSNRRDGRPSTLTVADSSADDTQLTRLRSKALATTLFARVFLGDLFVHGLGGGMYDQVTDQIIRDFYGIEPPRYAICTGTLRLPLERPGITPRQIQQHAMMRWELRHHPEKFFSAQTQTPQVREWLAEKARWVAIQPTKASARERCRAIRALNARLFEQLSAVEQRWHVDQRRLSEQLVEAQVLGSREYPWLWYPRETLAKFLLAFRAERP